MAGEFIGMTGTKDSEGDGRTVSSTPSADAAPRVRSSTAADPPLPLGPSARPENAGFQRLPAVAAKGERHDRALWAAPAAATGAAGNSTVSVGTPETVAPALLDHVDLGVTTFLLRGYQPLPDAEEFGRTRLPLVRQEVERRERAAPAAG